MPWPYHARLLFLNFYYGVGPARAKEILDQTKISVNKRAKDLTEEEISRITSLL
ncbi:MAG: 30S ribosomal protein S13, partial [Candidatus Omnitrophica bacterium]|nr:30S ribosomal protein S13 [Candidatus Omnitrophota bacterium]